MLFYLNQRSWDNQQRHFFFFHVCVFLVKISRFLHQASVIETAIKGFTGIIFKFLRAIFAGSKATLGDLETHMLPGPCLPSCNLHIQAARWLVINLSSFSKMGTLGLTSRWKLRSYIKLLNLLTNNSPLMTEKLQTNSASLSKYILALPGKQESSILLDSWQGEEVEIRSP